MSRSSLWFRYYDGPEIPEAVLRAAWSVRVEMLSLNKSAEEDWAYFASFVRREDTALLAFHDSAGAVQGFFTISYLPVEHEGKKRLLMFSKYYYFRKAYRGRAVGLLAPWVLLPIALRRFGWRSLHFVTSAYPQSFVSLSRTAGLVHSLRSVDIAPWQAAALSEFAARFYGDDFDAEAKIVCNQNVVDTESMPLYGEAQRLAAMYERLNPAWRQGCTLPILFTVDTRLVWHNLKRMSRRVLPRRVGRSAVEPPERGPAR